MTGYNDLVGEYVKIIIDRGNREEAVYCILRGEDDYTVFVEYKSGDRVGIGKKNIVKLMPWKKDRGLSKY